MFLPWVGDASCRSVCGCLFCRRHVLGKHYLFILMKMMTVYSSYLTSCCLFESCLQAEQSIFRLGNAVAFGVALSQSCANGMAQHCHSQCCGEFALFDSGQAVFDHVYHWVHEGERYKSAFTSRATLCVSVIHIIIALVRFNRMTRRSINTC